HRHPPPSPLFPYTTLFRSKPSNLLVAADDGTVKVLDMGLARIDLVGERRDTRGEEITRSGVVVGTPDYLAPEQAIDPRQADIRRSEEHTSELQSLTNLVCR